MFLGMREVSENLYFCKWDKYSHSPPPSPSPLSPGPYLEIELLTFCPWVSGSKYYIRSTLGSHCVLQTLSCAPLKLIPPNLTAVCWPGREAHSRGSRMWRTTVSHLPGPRNPNTSARMVHWHAHFFFMDASAPAIKCYLVCQLVAGQCRDQTQSHALFFLFHLINNQKGVTVCQFCCRNDGWACLSPHDSYEGAWPVVRSPHLSTVSDSLKLHAGWWPHQLRGVSPHFISSHFRFHCFLVPFLSDPPTEA